MFLPRRTSAQLGVALLCVLALPLIRFAWLNKSWAIVLQANFGYYAVLLAFALFLGFFALRWRAAGGWRTILRPHWRALLFVLGATVLIHLHEPHRLKVLHDEPSHVACSLMMHEERQTAVPGLAHNFYGSLLFENSFPSFRQYFFPFLISLVHDAIGYSPDNVFILNAVLTFFLLWIVYRLGWEYGGVRAGTLAVLLLTTLPLLAQNAASGGYDLLNLTLLAGLLWATLDYSRRPGIEGLNLMLITGVLLALTRYEALLYLFIPIAFVLLKWRRERAVTLTWFAAVSPLLLLPNLVSHLIMTTTDVFMASGLRSGGQAFFDLKNLAPHLGALAFFLFDFDTTGTNSFILSLAGAFGVVGLAAVGVLRHGLKSIVHRFQEMLRRRKSPDAGRPAARLRPVGPDDTTQLLLVATPVVLATYGFMLTQFWSSPADLMAARFALPTLLMFALCAVWMVLDQRREKGVPRVALWIVAGYILAFTIPSNAKHRTTNMLVVGRSYDWFVDYAKRHDHGRTLYVSGSNLPLVIHRYPSISIVTLNRVFESLTLAIQAGVYDEIIIHENLWVSADDGHLHANNSTRPDPRLVLEEVAREKFLPDSVSKLYRVVGYKNAAGELVTPANAPGLRRKFESEAEQIRYLRSLLK